MSSAFDPSSSEVAVGRRGTAATSLRVDALPQEHWEEKDAEVGNGRTMEEEDSEWKRRGCSG